MSVRVDYRCGRCGGVHERLVASPPPPVQPCPACGAGTRRVFSPLGVIGRAGPPPAPAAARSGPAACLTHRDVPALCHLDPSVATAWIARARGDHRTLERELARQEAAAAARPADVGPVADGHRSGHSHGSGHAYGSGHSHGPDHSHGPAPGAGVDPPGP